MKTLLAILFFLCLPISIAAQDGNKTMDQICIQVNGHNLTVDLVNNSSTKALLAKLREGDITIHMHDYGNFEKVGELPYSFPRNDEHIITGPGDVILYQCNRFVIYYDRNSWNFTRLGKIKDLTQDELKSILGDEPTATISIKCPGNK